MRLRWPAVALLACCLAPPLDADGPKAAEKKPDLKTYRVPYRLTDTQHVLVRIKINGKGPFNFIVDTGAPLLYVSVPVAKKAGLKLKGEKGGEAVTLDTLDIEGGISHKNVKCLVETPFQLKGMNAFGMAGEDLHGMLGYAILSKYRLLIDLKRDRMVWTRLDYQPPAPIPLGLKGDDPTGMEKLGPIMEGMAFLMGKRKAPTLVPRGFLGVEFEQKGDDVFVKSIVSKSPAAAAGVQAGDRILEVAGFAVGRASDVLRHAAAVTAGETVHLTVMRGTATKELKIKAGEGL